MSEFKADSISIVYSMDKLYASVNIEALSEEAKRAILEAVKNKLGFTKACEVLDIAKSSLYRAIFVATPLVLALSYVLIVLGYMLYLQLKDPFRNRRSTLQPFCKKHYASSTLLLAGKLLLQISGLS